MQTDRWQKIEEIFNRAVALPATEREKFIADACVGDEKLRREVLELLRADTAEENPLDEDVLTLAFQCLEHDEILPAGTRLAAYRIEKLLGRGGMGAVYLARDSRLEREVALKILPAHFAENRQNVERFRQEARAAGAVSHPNVAHIYEFGNAQDKYFLAMEYVEGKTLRELQREKPLDPERALEIARQIAAALDVTHRRGIVHRDIKPENIIITENNLVKILDFGLAKLTAPVPENSGVSLETTPGMIVGTTAYMSPEQIRGQRLDHRTDLWSLGVLLFEMLAGERPFAGETASDTQAAILLKDAPLAKIPTRAAPLVGRLLKKDAGERCQSIEEILPELERLKNELADAGKTAGKTAPSAFSEENDGGQPFAKTGIFLLPLAVAVAAAFGIYFSGGFPAFQAPETSAEIPKRQIESLAVLPFEVDGDDERINLFRIFL